MELSSNPVSSLFMKGTLAYGVFMLTRKNSFYQLFSLDYEWVKFSVVTPYPKALEGMIAFLLPLNDAVWAALVISCFGMCFLAQVGKHGKSFVTRMEEIFLDFIHTNAILLGQVNGENLKMFNTRIFGSPLIVVWLFCGRYIIMDNHYTGSIFSFLSAIKPPTVPETITDLVRSDIPLITVSSTNLPESILKRLIIPLHVNSLSKSGASKSFELYTALNRKLTFIDSSYRVLEFTKNILSLNLLTDFNSSVDTSRTYAIMDTEAEFHFYTTLLGANGNRLVINGKEETPFVSMTIRYGQSNCFHQLFARKMSHLSASGIESRWPKLERMGYVVKSERNLWNVRYQRYMAHDMSRPMDSNPSQYKEDPVKIEMERD
ncbi:hypothetical protein Fcan01_16961 [Folsomia candida]|uniref:Uncharacterized protein n=1 Tax=Folsomia candida TaxID=158441 RepID=A0A226DRE7_FOLCA|nr:hypothetical protein Fcan01_16961 [Folsomia candida]